MNLQFITATLAAFPVAPSANTRGKIIISNSMITNESGKGNPFALFNQPETFTENGSNSVPDSEGWIPSYNTGDFPLSFYVDLGADYIVDSAYLFDGQGNGSVSLAAGSPGSWQTLWTDTLQNYNVWNTHQMDTVTRYLRVSYDSYVDAKGCQEIVLYGKKK